MRTKGSDDLYRLIHSLTTEEKGYFKKFALRHSQKQSKHLQLFDTISKQTEFEEAGLKKKFKGYADMKGYLMEMILDALQTFETEPTGQQLVLKGLIRINILVKKGLLNAALKQIDKYLFIARKHSLFTLHTLLLKFESMIKRQTLNHKERIEYVSKLSEENTLLLEQQKMHDELLSQQYLLVAMYHIKNTIDYKSLLKKHIKLPLLTTPLNKETYAEILRLSALHKYYAIQNDLENLHKTGKHIMQREEFIWSKNKVEINTENFLVAINNFLVTGIETGRFVESEKALQLLQQIPISNEKIRLDNCIRYIHIRQIFYWAKGDHKKGYTFSEEMLAEQGFLQNFNYRQSTITSIHLMAAIFAMSVGEHQKTALRLSVFNQFPKNQLLPSTAKSVEWLQLLLQYEMQNFDLLKPIALSALKRIKNLTEPEKQFLETFAKHARNSKALITTLGASTCTIEIEPSFKIADWVQSKMQEVSLAKTVAARYKAK